MSVKLTESITFYEREDWGARPWRGYQDQGWDAREVFIHHTADEATGVDSFQEQCQRMRGYQNYHMDSHGWDDIGYHAIVFPPFNYLGDGEYAVPARIFQGRPRDHVPAAQEGHNYGTLAICVVRGGDKTMFKSQRYAIGVYLNYLKSAGSPISSLDGHREAPGQSTSCPGDGIIGIDLPALRNVTGLRNKY